tara:strand:+ start:9139 stop:9699 length:561 start_codon:yes stop_codon:yes gene_type:complete
MDYNFGMATVCPPGFRPNKRYRARRGQRQCLKQRAPKKTLKELQALALSHDVSIFHRRKDGLGFTKKPLSVKGLKNRLARMKVAYFGMATVCPPGFSPNPMWMRKPGQRQCLKDGTPASLRVAKQASKKMKPVKSKKMTLKQLQKLAKANDVSIFKRRKDDMGFTKVPLTMKALKYRLTKLRVPYK